VLEPPPHFTLGKPLRGNWLTMMPAKPTPGKRRENIEEKRLPWDNFPPMPSGYTICTAMSGSGAPILGMITMTVRRRMAVLGQKMGMIIILLRGAVLGTSTHFSAVPLTAAATTAATTSATVFGWCAVLGGLCNPFPLFFPFYPYFLFWNFFGQIQYKCIDLGVVNYLGFAEKVGAKHSDRKSE